MGFGAMDVTKPYEFIGFGAMYVTKPYEFIGFAMIIYCRDEQSITRKSKTGQGPHLSRSGP